MKQKKKKKLRVVKRQGYLGTDYYVTQNRWLWSWWDASVTIDGIVNWLADLDTIIDKLKFFDGSQLKEEVVYENYN